MARHNQNIDKAISNPFANPFPQPSSFGQAIDTNPNISSNKIKSRQKTNSNWYSWKTVVDLLQSYGRAVRSGDDYADFFILDSNFSDVLKYSSHYIPKYMQKAIKNLKI